MKDTTTSYKITITGLVQGVGFRPFIYRIARENHVNGWVENNIRGVTIEAEAKIDDLESFVIDIKKKAPPASDIEEILVEEIPVKGHADFEIKKSSDDTSGITEISPDIAICNDCLEDLKHQNHRINYPFTNCTNCGPRFTIIKNLPYDRHQTTMDVFTMCEVCHKEYTDVLDRRFHAQPVACNHCGPNYSLIENNTSYTDFDTILKKTIELVESGKIIAIKGIGGFQLMCDATNEEAVSTLRSRKLREGKPFAVMFRNLAELEKYSSITESEQNLLGSWRRPIVLLNYKKGLAPSVNNQFHRMGVMLPYMPFHHQLMEKLNTPAVVLTSGNLSDEPIILDNELAIKCLAAIADAFLVYNRDIFNRVDDSVSFVVNNKPRLIRRSRGFVPTPIRTKLNIDGIFAAGAELVNCFAIGKDKLALVSQHIGDLQNFETYEFYEETIEKYKHLFRLQTELVAVDMHPDYFSTRYGKKLGLKTVEVQHHHAHVASCMAEHGLDEKVIGVSLDGTGYGDDGHIWGSEFFICDLNTYQRETHFDYIPLPGGDAVTKEPWRTALSYLYTYFGKDFLDLGLDFLKDIPKAKIDLIIEAIDKNINAPLSSSCGRLFDTVSALINLCTVSKFHAEAPMRLESIASPNITESYPFDHGQIISFERTFRGIVDDLKNNIQPGIISAKFHNTVINVIFDTVNKIRENTGINKVVLSGGTFQNAILLRETERKLIENKFEVFAHQKVPSNDGGIALGQLAIAAKRRELKCV